MNLYNNNRHPYLLLQLLVVVLTAFANQSSADFACADVNTDACKLMQQDKPDLCNTSIGDTACPRFCGKCPLECFSCSDLVQDISSCNTMTCDFGQVCHSMEVRDFDKSHGFRGGCVSREFCVPQSLGPGLFGRSSSTVHITCCDTDRCNRNGDSATTSSSITTLKPTTTTRKTTTHHDSNCFDGYSHCAPDRCGPHIYQHCRKTCGRC